MAVPLSSRHPLHHLRIWSQWALVVSLAVVLVACGDDSKNKIETARAAIDYQNSDQAATFLAHFPVQTPYLEPPLPRIYRISSNQEAASFAEAFGVDLATEAEADLNFDTMDYFAVVEIVPCAHLVRRDAFVQSNRFIFEAIYRDDGDLVCPGVVNFRGTLFTVPTAR